MNQKQEPNREQSGNLSPSPGEVKCETLQNSPKEKNKFKSKSLLATGITLLVVAIIGFTALGITSGTKDVNMSVGEAQAVLTEGSSDTLPVGSVLLFTDADSTASAKDYAIYNKDGLGEAKIFIWDYAAVDGDYVQVFVDGEPVSDAFKIDHEPKEFNVPTSGVLQIKGIHDAGGGLTYAVYCNLNNNIYFNIAPEGELNTYTFFTG